jgi:hypothetical protein
MIDIRLMMNSTGVSRNEIIVKEIYHPQNKKISRDHDFKL